MIVTGLNHERLVIDWDRGNLVFSLVNSVFTREVARLTKVQVQEMVEWIGAHEGA